MTKVDTPCSAPRRLRAGDLLRAVVTYDGDMLRIGHHDIERIEVVMETGQMAHVPWAAVISEGFEACRLNLALCPYIEVVG